MSARATTLIVTVRAIDPPFTTRDGVLFGLQSGREVESPVAASATTEFEAEVTVRTEVDPVDFTGAFVHGPRGDRFLYLSWGVSDRTEPFVMVARAKLRLAQVPLDVLTAALDGGHRLCAAMQATDERGDPASGTIAPSRVAWTDGPGSRSG